MRRAAGAPGREPTRHLRTTVPTFKPPTSPNIITGITTLETVRRVVEPCIWEDVPARMFLRTGRAPVAGLKAKLCLFECRRTDPVHRCGRIAPPPRLVSVNPGMDCRSSEPARTALSPSELLYVIVAELLGGGGGRAVRAGRRCECGLWPLGQYSEDRVWPPAGRMLFMRLSVQIAFRSFECTTAWAWERL